MMRFRLANNDKPHRCPVWSVGKPGKCPGGSFAQAGILWGFGRNPNHMFLKCEVCGTWRLPTYGIRLLFWKLKNRY